MFMFHQRSSFVAALLFGASSLARSNGIIFAGFFWYPVLVDIINGNTRGCYILSRIFKALILSLISVSGYFLFQLYGYYSFCSLKHDIPRPWCESQFPMVYSFVQAHYWYAIVSGN